MFFKLIAILFLMGLIGFGGYTYTQYLESIYEKKEALLNEKINILRRKTGMKSDKNMKIQKQLSVEYKTLKKKLEDEFRLKEMTLRKKYGSFSEAKKRLKVQNSIAKKDIMQREKGLKRLRTKLAKREKSLRYRENKVAKKLASLKNIKMECRIFDLRKIDESVKDFQSVSYATRDKVNLFCGFDPSDEKLVNKNLCIRGRKDREKARSLLSLIYSTARNVKQRKSYRDYVRAQKYRMQISE